MAAAENEVVNVDGMVFKVRKKRSEADVAPSTLEAGQPHEDPKPVASQSLELKKKKQRLLTIKAMYVAELEAWERLEAAATPPSPKEPVSSPDKSPASCGLDPKMESLKELQIEVENVEEYIKRLQDHIILAESTYKLLVKDIREDANFQPAEEIVLALTGQAQEDPDVTNTQASHESFMSLTEGLNTD